MQTIDQMTAHPASRTRTPNRRLLVVAACIAVALVIGLGVKLWLDRVPPPNADAGRIARYMATPAFAALSDAEKDPYLDAFRRARDGGELTPKQLNGVLGNVEMGGEKDPIQQYFSMAPKQREKF